MSQTGSEVAFAFFVNGGPLRDGFTALAHPQGPLFLFHSAALAEFTDRSSGLIVDLNKS